MYKPAVLSYFFSEGGSPYGTKLDDHWRDHHHRGASWFLDHASPFISPAVDGSFTIVKTATARWRAVVSFRARGLGTSK